MGSRVSSGFFFPWGENSLEEGTPPLSEAYLWGHQGLLFSQGRHCWDWAPPGRKWRTLMVGAQTLWLRMPKQPLLCRN